MARRFCDEAILETLATSRNATLISLSLRDCFAEPRNGAIGLGLKLPVIYFLRHFGQRLFIGFAD
jgi:hypothetical protein